MYHMIKFMIDFNKRKFEHNIVKIENQFILANGIDISCFLGGLYYFSFIYTLRCTSV